MHHLAEIFGHWHDVVHTMLRQLMTTVLDVVLIAHEPLLEILQHSRNGSWCHTLEGPFPIRKLEVHIVMNVICFCV